MRQREKSYNTLLRTLMFVLCLLILGKGERNGALQYDFSLNKGVVFTYINANNNVNAFSDSKDAAKTNFVTVINENRAFNSEDNDFYGINDWESYYAKCSQALYSYIQNYSCDRVLHPKLEQLGILLI